MLPIACCQGHYWLVGCCVCPDTPPVASCQGSGGTVRWSAAASALTRRLSLVVGGQGALVKGWSGTLALLHCSLLGGTVSRPQDCHRMPRGQVGRVTQARRG
ncbi:hypothetical protein GW17_00049805 [Ensete ventricosum]|nr:hypothetical protein GW17_00049805 [Ensete ventricosum]